LQDGVDKALQRRSGQRVLARDARQFRRVLFRLEAAVAVADGLFA
jgi:hypothetical protein